MTQNIWTQPSGRYNRYMDYNLAILVDVAIPSTGNNTLNGNLAGFSSTKKNKAFTIKELSKEHIKSKASNARKT